MATSRKPFFNTAGITSRPRANAARNWQQTPTTSKPSYRMAQNALRQSPSRLWFAPEKPAAYASSEVSSPNFNDELER